MLWCFTDALFHNSVSLSWSRKTKKPLSNAEGSEMTHLILLKWLHSYCLSVSLKTLILPVEVCKGLEWFEGKHKMDHRWDENGCIAALFISLPYLAGGWRLLLTPWFIEKISFLLISQGRSGSRTIFWRATNPGIQWDLLHITLYVRFILLPDGCVDIRRVNLHQSPTFRAHKDMLCFWWLIWYICVIEENSNKGFYLLRLKKTWSGVCYGGMCCRKIQTVLFVRKDTLLSWTYNSG